MPGLFFEFSILLGNPDLASQLILRTQGLALGRYLNVLVGLFLAFVIGNALIQFASLIQFALGRAYKAGLFLWEQFQERVLLPTLAPWVTIPASTTDPNSAPNPTPRPLRTPHPWLLALYVRTLKTVRRIRSTEPTAAYLWWETLAKQLLLKRYGLPEEKLPEASFQPLQDVLTTPSPEELRGSVLVVALQATGWAALFASRFAPALWNKWYIIFALFLIGSGLLHDWYVAKRLNDPNLGDTLRLRAVLREFPKIPLAGTAQIPPHAPDQDA